MPEDPKHPLKSKTIIFNLIAAAVLAAGYATAAMPEAEVVKEVAPWIIIGGNALLRAFTNKAISFKKQN